MNEQKAKELSTENDLWLRTNCWSPPGCHPVGCGLYCHIVDGKLVGVEGDEDQLVSQGRVCARALCMDEVVYHEERITTPMKRDPKFRGQPDKWEEITWDEAFDLLEVRTKEIQEKYGMESVVVYNGTGRESVMWSYALSGAAFRSPNSIFPMSGYSCYGPRSAIAFYILGSGYPEIDYAAYFADRYEHEGWELPKYIIIWGKYPLISNPDGLFGHSLVDLHKRGTKFITIDPRVTWLATKSEYHIQLRPGTDAAIALAMINVIISEDLYNHDFVENYCYGFEELKARAAEYPVEKVAEYCWCSAEVITGAARAFATNGPSSICWGLAFDTNKNGVQAGHACLSLAAICGYIDVPGGLTIGEKEVFLGKWRADAAIECPPDVWRKRLGTEEYPGYVACQCHGHPDLCLDALETGEPYPIKETFFHATNFLASTAGSQGKRWYRAMRDNCEFNIGCDVFMTPSIQGVCDLYLPVSMVPEHNGVVQPHFGRNMYALLSMNKVIEAPGTMSDLDIMLEIGKRLNPDYWNQWTDGDQFFDDWLSRFYDFDLAGLRDDHKGTFLPGYEYYKFEKGLLRPDGKKGFNTPTGKIELYSTLYEIFGDDPLPYFMEPTRSPYASPDLYEEYPLVLTTGARKWGSFHSEHRQVATLRDIDPDPIVEINPIDAEKYGITTGDWVAVENDLDKCILRAKVTEVVMPGVVHAQHGWWFPEQEGEAPNLYGVWKSNINSLIPHKDIGKIGFGAPFKNVICKVYKVESLDAFDTAYEE